MRIRIAGRHETYHAGSRAVWQRMKAIAGAELVEPPADYDLLIVNGEGTMHHGNPGFHAKMALLREALDAGRRAWLVNTVWQDNPPDHDDVLPRLDGVVVRETLSREDLWRRHGVLATVALDFSAHAEPVPPNRPLLDAAGGVMVTDFLAPGFGGFVRVVEGELASHAQLDLRAGNWGWAVESVRTARLLVTGRHHAVYAACLARVPFVALTGNTHKIEGMIRSAGFNIPVCREPSELRAAIRRVDRHANAYAALFDWFHRQPPWALPRG